MSITPFKSLPAAAARHVHVIEDSAVVAESLLVTLQRLGYSAQVYGSAQEFLSRAQPVTPAVILLDMHLPGMSGVELQKQLLAEGQRTPIIFISGESESREIVQAMKQGAIDFLFKPFDLHELLAVIDKGLDQDRSNTLQQRHQTLRHERFGRMTTREREVCSLLGKGLMNKQIAIELGISEATVKVHKARVLEKMQVSSLQELAIELQQMEEKDA